MTLGRAMEVKIVPRVTARRKGAPGLQRQSEMVSQGKRKTILSGSVPGSGRAGWSMVMSAGQLLGGLTAAEQLAGVLR